MKRRKTHLRRLFTAEHKAWINAIHRCHNQSHQNYCDYGARGIRVADEWRTESGFAAFLDHLGPRPSPDYSLDRIDNDNGNYAPGEVRWTDRTTQQNNRRALRRGCRDYGWGVGLTVKTKSGRGHGAKASPLIPLDGRVQTLIEWSRELGLAAPTIRQRLNRGLTPAQALNPSTSRAGEKRKMATNALILPTKH